MDHLGGFWALDADRIRIARYDDGGSVVQTLELDPSWFATVSTGDIGSYDRPPEPRVQGIAEDAAGLLWIYAHVPSKNYASGWARARKALAAGAKEMSVGSFDMDSLYTTRVVVVDPRSKTLVTSSSMPRRVMTVMPDGRIVFYIAREEIPYAAIYRPRLVRK